MANVKVYFDDWEAEGFPAMVRDFAIDSAALNGCEVLAAAYTYENYSGAALVVFAKDGQLYEVNGGHCSCYGLEGQWEPEATTVAAMRMRTFGGYSPGFTQALLNALERFAATPPGEAEHG